MSMRFELLLRSLPELTPEEAPDKLAGLPKGLSLGVIVKSLQDGRVPTIAVAWSEDKRVINEIHDRLLDLGADSRIVDHGFFVLRIGTAISELLGASRYRKQEKEDRNYIKMRGQKARSSLDGTPFMEHLGRFALQLLIVEALFVWRLGLDVGIRNVGSIQGLTPRAAVCALGVFAAYVLSNSIQAWRARRIGPVAAVPPILLSTALTVGAAFYVHVELKAEDMRLALKQPPSNPFAGLLVELRRRATEEGPRLSPGDEPLTALEDLKDPTGEGLCIDQSGWEQGLRECTLGQDWESCRACLEPPARPPIDVSAFKNAPFKKATAATPARRTVMRPWGLRLELLHLSSLLLFWMVSMVAVHWITWRKKSKVKLESAPDQATSPEGKVEEGQNRSVPAAVAESAPDTQAADAQIRRLEQQLAEAQNALTAQQDAVAKLRQRAKEITAQQAEENLKLRQYIARVTGQPMATPASAGQPPAPRSAANNQEAPRPAPAVPARPNAPPAAPKRRA